MVARRDSFPPLTDRLVDRLRRSQTARTERVKTVGFMTEKDKVLIDATIKFVSSDYLSLVVVECDASHCSVGAGS